MNIKRLLLKNFRNIENGIFELSPRFNVVIGHNGTGKSTLLHAMQVATGAFFLGLPRVNRRHIQENEIRFTINLKSKQSEYFTPTIVEATGHINGSEEFTWRRVIPEYGRATSAKAEDVGQIRELAERYSKSLNDTRRPLLPLISFYGVKQLGGNVVRKKWIKKNRVIIRDGYYNALGAKSDENPFTQWFYYYREELKDGLEFKGTYEAVIEAIETAIPYLKNVSFDNFRLELVADCEIEGQPTKRLPHSLMSDGVKRMLGIVTDIAYRCVVLNGFLGNNAVKESRGLVMIDELDLHLHPTWQKQVVGDLKRAFPKIQFVATTHSPFIVQSLKSDELINLDKLSDVEPLDLSLEEVAEEIMGVDDSFANENTKMESISSDYLYTLSELKKGDKSKETKLDELEAKISDPSIRAFLKMKRMERTVKQ